MNHCLALLKRKVTNAITWSIFPNVLDLKHRSLHLCLLSVLPRFMFMVFDEDLTFSINIPRWAFAESQCFHLKRSCSEGRGVVWRGNIMKDNEDMGISVSLA